MEIEGKNVFLLGGAGEVGFSIARKIIEKKPKKLVLASLLYKEAKRAVLQLRGEFEGVQTEIVPEYGNIFLPRSWRWEKEEEEEEGFFKHNLKALVTREKEKRRELLEFVYLKPVEEVVEESLLYHLFKKHEAHIVVDSINTATGVAYQNVYESVEEVLRELYEEKTGELADKIELAILSISIPQLVRHIQILHGCIKRLGIRSYIKVGTTGTGGMGLNIPYTHGEESPSRVLMTKSAVAGAHTLLLFLLGRTPGCGAIKEIKPAALIAWKDIRSGPIRKRGKPIPLYDCPPEAGFLLKDGEFFDPDKVDEEKLDSFLEDVFVDTGENGLFSLEEFKAITSLYQMEFVTPEEVAEAVVDEIIGISTGKDVVAALDSSVMGATYRAGFLRNYALKKLEEELERFRKEKGFDIEEGALKSVAFEILGPPKLSKLLFEAHLLRETVGTIEKALEKEPEELSRLLSEKIEKDRLLRSYIISIGIPILMPQKRLIFSKRAETAGSWKKKWKISEKKIREMARVNWVDLTEQNMKLWKERLSLILNTLKGKEYRSSFRDITEDFWPKDGREHRIEPGDIVAFIFIEEMKGRKMKH